MKFGYVWQGSGAIPKAQQAKALSAYGCTKQRISVETSPDRDTRDEILSIIRENDEICVFSASYIADDIVELHWILGALGSRGAALYVVEFSEKFVGSQAMARITEDYIGEKRKEQTKAARDRLKKLPRTMRGGRPRRQLTEDETPIFIAMWNNKFKSKGDLARYFKCHKDKLEEWRKDLGLDEKAGQ